MKDSDNINLEPLNKTKFGEGCSTSSLPKDIPDNNEMSGAIMDIFEPAILLIGDKMDRVQSSQYELALVLDQLAEQLSLFEDWINPEEHKTDFSESVVSKLANQGLAQLAISKENEWKLELEESLLKSKLNPQILKSNISISEEYDSNKSRTFPKIKSRNEDTDDNSIKSMVEFSKQALDPQVTKFETGSIDLTKTKSPSLQSGEGTSAINFSLEMRNKSVELYRDPSTLKQHKLKAKNHQNKVNVASAKLVESKAKLIEINSILKGVKKRLDLISTLAQAKIANQSYFLIKK
ncbi:hypothetical protein BB558_000379 [Smittium angustum]|uniref:Uncharacterized protein n=1 Tax=Smittium angustum TaxID=133377 RepID=A0A2U1JED7_SMIAN|nr:hypothetical protein BB558_000379 [Smittium angustum]